MIFLFETQFIFIFAHLHLQTHTHRLTLIHFSSFTKTFNFCDVLYPISYVQLLRICKCKEARERLCCSSFTLVVQISNLLQRQLSSFFFVNNVVYTVFQKLTSFNIYLLLFCPFCKICHACTLF